MQPLDFISCIDGFALNNSVITVLFTPTTEGPWSASFDASGEGNGGGGWPGITTMPVHMVTVHVTMYDLYDARNTQGSQKESSRMRAQPLFRCWFVDSRDALIDA